jgi:outer membrane protein assembly factor BamC
VTFRLPAAQRGTCSAVSTPRPRRTGVAVAAAAAAALGLAACTASTDGLFSGDKVDYRTEAVKTRPLEVPPDLSQLARESRYQPVGGTVSAAAAASAVPAAATAAATAAGTPATVAISRLAGMRIERAGQQRWLVVAQQTPEQLWPKLRSFWEQNGFTLTLDNPQAGLMETNWSQNRAKLPTDVVRNLIGRLANNLYDTGERDLYRTRLERVGDGAVEIYISHRGIEEFMAGPARDQDAWRARPSDPELEAEMLARLMLTLGASAEAPARPASAAVASTVAAVASAPQGPTRARATATGERAAMELDEPFDRAWRRVGLVLDRGGFTVEDRDRAAGIYYVRYSDPKVAGQDEPNFFARIFGGAKDPQTPVRYRLVLKGNGDKTNIDVLTSDGGTGVGENGQRIITRLVTDMK